MKTSPLDIRSLLCVFVLTTGLTAAPPAGAVPAGAEADSEASARIRVGEIFGITPDRVTRFRVALQDFLSTPPPATDVLALESRWSANVLDEVERGDVVVPLGGRDLAFEETFLLRGREEAHEDAARSWVERSLKGSPTGADVASLRATSRGLSPRLGWDHGATVGLRAGPVRAHVGDGEWQVRYDRLLRLETGAPWRATAWVSEEDGELEVAFLVGRSLLAARR